jgi:hypothetical protein
MPSEAELEAEAERERDRSRKEAERILTREAEQRKLVEERVLAMMESTRSLPPPPSRSHTLSNPPSPSSSQKESPSWWTAAKTRLTPTKDKEPLTPAQQVIQETKAREKQDKKGKGKEKEKDTEKEKEWPSNTERKYSDPAFLNLNVPVPPPQRKPVPASPSSPTPSRPNLSNLPPNLTPSPLRSGEASSPSREAPPLYAQFTPQGTLDVPVTLLTIAKRFEKLEKWTVGHVRALEDRMNDVERWLVDKEKEREEKEEQASKASLHEESQTPSVARDLQEIRDDISELQGRLGELGREMAKLATAPSNLSPGPSRHDAPLSVAPQTTSSIAILGDDTTRNSKKDTNTTTTAPTTPRDLPKTPITSSHTSASRLVPSTARESTSPPMALARTRAPSGTRLPYPTGDYASPPEGAFSPSHSPPSSLTSATRPLSIVGLPTGTGAGLGLGIGMPYSSGGSISSGSGIFRTMSPPVTTRSPPPKGLPPPKSGGHRTSSVSPTPRKRYTVALGGPIIAPDDFDYDNASSLSAVGTAFFSSSPVPADEGEEKDDSQFRDDTIGKSAATKLNNTSNTTSLTGGDYKPISTSTSTSTSSPSPSSSRRIRAQSTYGFSNLSRAPQTPITPLRPQARSRSIDRMGSGEREPPTPLGGSKFVDPLVLRRQDRKVAMPKPVGKVPIGQLVAFFDGEKR